MTGFGRGQAIGVAYRQRTNASEPGWHPPGWRPDRPPPRQPDPDTARRPPLDEWLEQRLFDHRVVLVHGFLDGDLVRRVAAQLVALDALGGHRITMHLDSHNGDVEAALQLVDTMDTLHVPVHAFATGEVGGAALGVLAAARHRTAFPHARFRLVEPRVSEDLKGSVDQLVSQARLHEEMVAALVRRLARVALKSPETVARDLREGSYLTAAEAVEYGLVDAIAGAAGDRYGSGFTPRQGDEA